MSRPSEALHCNCSSAIITVHTVETQAHYSVKYIVLDLSWKCSGLCSAVSWSKAKVSWRSELGANCFTTRWLCDYCFSWLFWQNWGDIGLDLRGMHYSDVVQKMRSHARNLKSSKCSKGHLFNQPVDTIEARYGLMVSLRCLVFYTQGRLVKIRGVDTWLFI